MKNIIKTLFIISLTAFVFICGLMIYKYVVRHNIEASLEELIDDTRTVDSGTISKKETVDSAKTSKTGNADSAAESSSTDSSSKEKSNIPETTESVDILAQRGIVIPEKNINWTELQGENSDIYAWIYIPGTNIDYPILQHPEEKSYYLKHNLDGSEGYPGCIYTQNVNSKDWTDPNTVIFGHNMNNGSMFHDLHNFENATFFNETQFVYIYTPDKTLVYEVFAAYPFSDVDLIMCFDYSTPEALLVYFDGIWTNRSMTSHFRDDVILYQDSRIITMSTCIGGQPDMRYLVQAVFLSSQ